MKISLLLRIVQWIRKYFLEWVVFVCGASVMAFEITGAKMLGPYIGTSMFVWAGIIGVVLFSLSAGYLVGGRLADRKADPGVLARIVVAAGILFLVVAFVRKPFLEILLGQISDFKLAGVVASLVLFAAPALLLGMVSPFAARLKITAVQTSGATVGRLYALSTFGSITGTLAAGFILIPSLRITHIMIVLGLFLIVSGILLYFLYQDKMSSDQYVSHANNP